MPKRLTLRRNTPHRSQTSQYGNKLKRRRILHAQVVLSVAVTPSFPADRGARIPGRAFAVLVLLGMASPSAMEYLFTEISKGGTDVNKSEYMPAFEGTIAKDDIENVIAFIRTLVLY